MQGCQDTWIQMPTSILKCKHYEIQMKKLRLRNMKSPAQGNPICKCNCGLQRSPTLLIFHDEDETLYIYNGENYNAHNHITACNRVVFVFDVVYVFLEMLKETFNYWRIIGLTWKFFSDLRTGSYSNLVLYYYHFLNSNIFLSIL